MPAVSKTPATERQILVLGPYGVLGTGVIDAVTENPNWGITTAARRPAPTYWAQAAPPHINVDLMDREGTTKAFSSLNKVTDLSEKGPLWDAMVARYGLHATPYDQIANWSFVDWMLNFGEETNPEHNQDSSGGFCRLH